MKLLKLEFFKCRRRKILLVCAAVLAAELLWFGMYLTRQDAEDLIQGWMLLFYNLALIDAIILPISVATISSRNCELEHKGASLKLLETMVTPGRLYGAKLAWGALVLAALLIVRTGAFAVMGVAADFHGAIPWGRFAIFTAISWAVSMMVYALQQGLSLRFQNQAVALVAGIFGSFVGTMSMLFPPALVRCVPWGYYGLLSLVRMEWDPATRFTQFFWQWPQPMDLALLCLWAAVFLLVGRALFVRKEV
ncbi:ABC transporter permease [Flintibacter sp.]|uniref:ABC transporter permease n=1 Tax=Flintibacter sp. TaxID=1918624 RepID=UPI003A320004